MESLNVILYGPPGTGKTFRTSSLAVQRIESLSSDQLTQQYPSSARRLLRRRVDYHRREGRYAFVAFHPSFSYEDFVEGIRPYHNDRDELLYRVEDGLFKQMCTRAAYALYLAQQKNVLAQAPQHRDFDMLFFEFVDYLKRSLTDDSQETVFESKTGKPFYLVDINQNNTLSLRMGQGKLAYAVTKGNLSKIYRTFASADEIQHLRRDMPASVQRNSSVAWAVFNRLKHFENTRNQTYRYLLEGRGEYNEEHYQSMKRDVRQLDYASLTDEDYATAGYFVLVIDEINRGNIPAIFGELISLLEPDKRAGRSEALQTTLPYSRETFSVPPNLFLVGTMNTADRSVEALDTALRRRFTFEALYPDPTLLGSIDVSVTMAAPASDGLSVAAERPAEYAPGTKTNMFTLDLKRLLTAINHRLSLLLDADHQLGHGYLMPVMSAERPLVVLRRVMYHQIIPLLQEYFFNETEKVVLVLGGDFFTATSVSDLSLFAPGVSPEDWPSELSYQKTYRLRELSDGEFTNAILRAYE